MKVELRAEARFYFVVSFGLCQALVRRSREHYDGACQRASSRVGKIGPGTNRPATENGIVTIWFDHFDATSTTDDLASVGATWSQLDLIAKICENWDHEAPPYVVEFGRRIRRMFEIAGPKVMKEWKHEFDV